MRVTRKDLKRFFPGMVVSIALIAMVAVLLFVSLEDNRPPSASVDVSSLQVNQGEEVVLDGSMSSDPDGDDLEFLWTIDDTFSTTEMNFTFVFSEPGTHTVILKVTDGSGNYDLETVLIDVLI